MGYIDYWGLTRAPFDNVPDPSMYFDQHTSAENTVAEVLFAIEEGNECLAVIVGDVGLGKTMAMRIILDSLEQDKYNIAFVTNPDLTFLQLLREVIGQLTGKQCEIKRKEDLLERLNQLLFQSSDIGKKVLLFVDEANAIRPANLESLRLLTNLQDDTQNLLTIILAGQPELARRLEHPRRANLFQRIGVYCQLQKIESKDRLKSYVEHRLKVAGGDREIFTDPAIDQIWEQSEQGVPRLTNKLCKLCLKAGETNQFNTIEAATVESIAARFRRLSLTPETKRRERKRHLPAKQEEKPAPVLEPALAEPAETAEAAGATVQTGDPEAILRSKYDIPTSALVGATNFSPDYKAKLAGTLAAQFLKKRPELLAQSAQKDPFKLWEATRDDIRKELERLR